MDVGHLGNDGVPTVEAWLSKELPAGAKVGVDPQLMSEHVFKKFSDALECSGQIMVSVSHNLIDVVWGRERPPRPSNPLIVLDTKYSGVLVAVNIVLDDVNWIIYLLKVVAGKTR